MEKHIYNGKKFSIFIFLFFSTFCSFVNANQEPNLINVKIALMESLSPTAPSSSERYKRLYEAALYYALGENEEKLNKCGFKVTTKVSYFDSFDGMDMLKKSEEINALDVWAIIGPRRSHHLKAVSTVIKNTPIISTMANSDDISQRNSLVFSLYPSASILAKLVVKEVHKQDFGKVYGTIVDARCPACIDFSKIFNQSNTNHYRVFYLEVGDNTPNKLEILNIIKNNHIDYLLLPNYSELSGYIISTIQQEYPKIKYVGADGWGEDTFSFLQGYQISRNTRGLAIRFGPQKDDKSDYYRVSSLNRDINGEVFTPPYSVYALISIIRTLAKDLCDSSAQNPEEFREYMSQKKHNHFQQNPIYSIYQIENGELTFSKYIQE